MQPIHIFKTLDAIKIQGQSSWENGLVRGEDGDAVDRRSKNGAQELNRVVVGNLLIWDAKTR